MFEISPTDVRLPALFKGDTPNRPMLFGVLQGYNPGRAFVDDLTNPTRGAVRLENGLVFLSQPLTQEHFDQMLTYLRGISNVGLIWRPGISAIEVGEAAKLIQRLDFSDCQLTEAAATVLQKRLPTGFEFRLCDRALLEQCEWRPMIESDCGSLDNFLKYSWGVCLMHADEIIAEAYAPFLAPQLAEIGIVTREAHRGQGYGIMACAHLIQLGRARGYEPYWSCDADNLASVKLARKLGFQREQAYEIRLYRKLAQ